MTPLVVVKNKNKDPIQYKSKESIRLEKRVAEINALLKETDIILKDDTILSSSTVCLDDIGLYRVFNNGGLKDGGRFYGGFWQRISSDNRAQILINGEETEELDFSGQHIGMLYATLGHEIPEKLRVDPYKIEDSSVPRKTTEGRYSFALSTVIRLILQEKRHGKNFLKKQEGYENSRRVG